MAIAKITGADCELQNSILNTDRPSTAVSSWLACDRLLAEAPGWTDRWDWSPSASHGSYYSGYSEWGSGHQGQAGSDDRYGGGRGASMRAGSDGGGGAHQGGYPGPCGYGNILADGSPGYAAPRFRDYSRRWGNYCFYGDMGHCEFCIPECISCLDHTALVHGAYNIVADMLAKANARLPGNEQLFVAANNSDGTLATSWGGHFNVCVERQLFSSLFERKPHMLGFLASYLAAATPIFGQGHILRWRNGRARFTLSSRAHHLGVLVDPSTTIPYRRPLINARDESHSASTIARLHLINFDTVLQQTTLVFRVWLTQAVLAAMEVGFIATGLLLDDPVKATQRWSAGFDPKANAVPKRCRLASGGTIGLIELLEGFTEVVERLYEDGKLPQDIVPETSNILPAWKDSLQALRSMDMARLARRFDWALKYRLIERHVRETGGRIGDDESMLMNQLYGHLDKEVGLYWAFERSGFVDTWVDNTTIARLQREGPNNTRAYARRLILEKFPESISHVDWGEIRIRVQPTRNQWQTQRRINLDDPREHTKAEIGSAIAGAETPEQLCEALGAEEAYGSGYSGYYIPCSYSASRGREWTEDTDDASWDYGDDDAADEAPDAVAGLPQFSQADLSAQ